MNTPLLAHKDWFISPVMHCELLELYGRYAQFEDDSYAMAQIYSRFGLRPFTEYRIIVEP